MFIGLGTVARLSKKHHEIGVKEVNHECTLLHTNQKGRRNEHEKTEQAKELTADYAGYTDKLANSGHESSKIANFLESIFWTPIFGLLRKQVIGPGLILVLIDSPASAAHSSRRSVLP